MIIVDTVGLPQAVKDKVVCGGGFDYILADSIDEVAPNCEEVFISPEELEEFDASVPQSFWEGLP